MKQEKKRISFFLYSLIGGGAERIAINLANHLAEDYQVHLVLFNLPIEYPISEKIQIKILRPHYPNRFIRLITLPFLVVNYLSYCKQEKIDISISFDNLPNFINSCLSFSKSKVQTHLYECNHPSTYYADKNLHNRVHRFLINTLYPRVNKIYVNAWRIAEDLQDTFNIQVPKTLIANPVDIALIIKKRKN